MKPPCCRNASRVASYKEMKDLMQLIRPNSKGLWNCAPPLPSYQSDAERIENRPVHWGISPSANRIIFLEGDIFDPMQTIFNLPMLPGSLEQV